MDKPSSSTPRGGADPTSGTTASGIPDIDQDALKDRLAKILNGHTWQFRPHDIARMLSPRFVLEECREDAANRPLLEHFDLLIEDPVVVHAMNQAFADPPPPPIFVTDERANYIPVADFLNDCVAACNEAYDMIAQNLHNGPFTVATRDKRWFPNLSFLKYDRETGDRVRGATRALKPDVIGIDAPNPPDDPADVLGYWNLPDELEDDRKANQIEIVCDLKSEWKPMVPQVGTYGRALFTRCPQRVFTLAFAIDHISKVMRVFIFHHGGLTASHAISLAHPGINTCGPVAEKLARSRRDFLEILLSILLWQGPADAGFLEFTDGEEWVIPSGDDGSVTAKQKAVLYYHPLVRSRETFVAVLEREQPPQPLPSAAGSSKGPAEITAGVQRMTLRSAMKKKATVPKPVVPPAENTPTGQCQALIFITSTNLG